MRNPVQNAQVPRGMVHQVCDPPEAQQLLGELEAALMGAQG